MTIHGNAVSSSVMTITPEIAASMLQQNSTNRPLISGLVKRYAHILKRGAWRLNGEAIILSGDGSVLDGQHRLHAIIQSGVPVQTVVTSLREVSGEEANRKIFDSLDSGRSRTNAERLSGVGEKNAALLSSSLIWLSKYHRGVTTWASGMKLEPDEMEFLLRENEGIREWLTIGAACSKTIGGTPSLMVFAFYAAQKASREKADLFISQLVSGAELKVSDPALILRNRLLANRSSQAKLRPNVLLAFFIKAWNAFYKGSELKMLKLTDSEDFPEFVHYPMMNTLR